MKTAYAPDNTRTSLVIVLGLALVVTLAAVLIGLSDKPQVDAIGIRAGLTETDAANADNQPTSPDDDSIVGLNGDEDNGTGAGAGADATQLDSSTGDPATAADANEPTVEREIIVIPTTAPTPTPEVAAAVEPTAIPETSEESTGGVGDVQAAPSLPTTSGTVQGSFFTKTDENEGAEVRQNLITVSFAQDGSGSFQGVLDITYADGTHILLNMQGPLTWAANNPQVETMLVGKFTLDAPIDTDDITTDDAELTISSLGAGSGSLCTSRCFGFTFPPQ